MFALQSVGVVVVLLLDDEGEGGVALATTGVLAGVEMVEVVVEDPPDPGGCHLPGLG